MAPRFPFAGTVIDARRVRAEQIGVDHANWDDDQLRDDVPYNDLPQQHLQPHPHGGPVVPPTPPPHQPRHVPLGLTSGSPVSPRRPAPRLETVSATASEWEVFAALAQDMAQAQIVQPSCPSQGSSGILRNSEEQRIRAMHQAIGDDVYGPDRSLRAAPPHRR